MQYKTILFSLGSPLQKAAVLLSAAREHEGQGSLWTRAHKHETLRLFKLFGHRVEEVISQAINMNDLPLFGEDEFVVNLALLHFFARPFEGDFGIDVGLGDFFRTAFALAAVGVFDDLKSADLMDNF